MGPSIWELMCRLLIIIRIIRNTACLNFVVDQVGVCGIIIIEKNSLIFGSAAK